MNLTLHKGRVATTPELKKTSSGISILMFNIAINNGKNKQGEERTPYYFKVIIFNDYAETCYKHLYKGQKILLEGSLRQNTYKDKDGELITFVDILGKHIDFLEYKDTGKVKKEFNVEIEEFEEETGFRSISEEITPF